MTNRQITILSFCTTLFLYALFNSYMHEHQLRTEIIKCMAGENTRIAYNKCFDKVVEK